MSSSSKSTIEKSSSREREPKLKLFVREKSGHLIEKLEEQMKSTRESQADEESVHHLRTSIRRLSECLRTFDNVFPGGEAGRLRRKLRKLMDLAAEVRNRDIAGELFLKAGIAPDHPLMTRLETEKVSCRHALLHKLGDLHERNRPERWRGHLQ